MSGQGGPWLHIIGMGADGLASLLPLSRAALEEAEVIVGSERLHALTSEIKAERMAWPSPFDMMVETIAGLRGRKVAVLATGDPLWFSVGARLGRIIPPAEIRYHPQLSAFQLAASRLGWSLADLETLTAHGRPPEQILPFVAPGVRMLVLTAGAETPGQVAKLLCERGYGQSRMVVFSDLGAESEARAEGRAENWQAEVGALNTLAVECIPGPGAQILPRVAGLPDDAFVHDGKMTKREVRAMTIAQLMPQRGGLLWDIGSGAGSVAIEWMRAAPDARAIGIEPMAARREMAAQNAMALGVPKLDLRAGSAPEALADLPEPDAVFLGGGLSEQ
ncbi:MAG: precorrin-6y C5,15-methyltransferase (decarboxylating) subunit CbiE, partial [Mangrovicoccus sp.]|nr:precorrin-6y C5,15-methyltransferase (decarboxylating) subunit CbiE [Mangrovicoccus sp.]